MIELTKMGSGEKFLLNPTYIESIEETPTPTVHLHEGTTYLVQESPQEVVRLIRAWRNDEARP